MKLHIYPPNTTIWTDVLPGDYVVSPGSCAFSISEMDGPVTKNTRARNLGHHPFLILAVSEYESSRLNGLVLVTYTVLARSGIFQIIKDCAKSGI